MFDHSRREEICIESMLGIEFRSSNCQAIDLISGPFVISIAIIAFNYIYVFIIAYSLFFEGIVSSVWHQSVELANALSTFVNFFPSFFLIQYLLQYY
jgi:hypothetical protein